MKSNDLLDHLEKVRDDYEVLVEKIPMEDKLIMSREEALAVNLEPWEISEIVQGALGQVDAPADNLFDVIYDAISEALDKARR